MQFITVGLDQQTLSKIQQQKEKIPMYKDYTLDQYLYELVSWGLVKQDEIWEEN